MNAIRSVLPVEVLVVVDQVRLDQHPAAGLERRPHADVDRRRHPVGERRVDAVARVDVLLVGDQVRGREAERAPALVALDHRRPRAGTARRGSASRPRRRRRRPGPGSGSRRRSRRRPRPAARPGLELRRGRRASRGRPCALLAEAEVLAHRDPLGARAARPGSASRTPPPRSSRTRCRSGITTSSVDAEALDHVALDLERHDQLRRRLGVDHAQRVRLEGEHRVGALDHLAVADVDAVEGADRDLARAPLGLGEGRDRDAHRRQTLPARDGRARSVERDRPLRLVGLLDRERADRGPPQLGAVGVAEVGDQAADVGARRALDLELGLARRRARAARSGARSTSRSGSSKLLAAARAPVGALAADLDRRVGGRALADLPGRQLERARRHDARSR